MKYAAFNRISLTLVSFLFASIFLIGANRASAQEATPGVVGDAVTTECVTDLGTSEVPNGATSFTVDSEQSEVRYKVEEELAGQGTNEAVGATNAVIGTILIDEDGNPLPCSRFDVDLRTLVTDDSKRDARVQDVLQTSQHPVATFIVTEVTVPDGGLVDGEETAITLTGNLELHGVTHQVTWTGTVTRDGDTISGTAMTQVSFDDYEVDKPVIGPVMSIDDTLTLEIDLVANAG